VHLTVSRADERVDCCDRWHDERSSARVVGAAIGGLVSARAAAIARANADRRSSRRDDSNNDDRTSTDHADTIRANNWRTDDVGACLAHACVAARCDRRGVARRVPVQQRRAARRTRAARDAIVRVMSITVAHRLVRCRFGEGIGIARVVTRTLSMQVSIAS
jgi:hypothetical protein